MNSDSNSNISVIKTFPTEIKECQVQFKSQVNINCQRSVMFQRIIVVLERTILHTAYLFQIYKERKLYFYHQMNQHMGFQVF